MVIRGKILRLVAVAMMCSWVNTCGPERKPENASTTEARKPIADSNQRLPLPSPVSWAEVVNSYDRVTDYVCLYEKTEKAISKGEQQRIHLSFRKPFDVRMDWLDSQDRVTQTAVYRQGLNDGRVLARENGLLGSLAGTLKLDPGETLALSDSRHPITEVGIGKIIDRSQHDAANPGIASRFAGEEVLFGKPAYKFEFVASDNEDVGGLGEARKALVWIDRELKLPIKLELYDSTNALLEQHSFKGLRLNQKLGDKTFTL